MIGAAIVSARGAEPYASVEEIQRRAGVGAGALDRIGDADGFGSLRHSRRTGLWDVKGLRDSPLPLFAAADEREGKLRAEAVEPEVALSPMAEGQEPLVENMFFEEFYVEVQGTHDKRLALMDPCCAILFHRSLRQ